MSAIHSGLPEKVDGILRNQWPTCSGITGRHGPESVADMLRILQEIQKIIEPHIGKHEIIYCEIFKTGTKNSKQLPMGGKMIGYDIAYPGGDCYSAIRNGIHYPSSELEKEYKSLLNEFGLFSDIEIIIP